MEILTEKKIINKEYYQTDDIEDIKKTIRFFEVEHKETNTYEEIECYRIFYDVVYPFGAIRHFNNFYSALECFNEIVKNDKDYGEYEITDYTKYKTLGLIYQANSFSGHYDIVARKGERIIKIVGGKEIE